MAYLVHRPGVKAAKLLTESVALARPQELVGVWDMDAYVENLPAILDAMNAAQARVRFTEVLAAVPPGLVYQPEAVNQWSRTKGEGMKNASAAPPSENIWAHDFAPQAKLVADDLELDYIIGLTGAMVAFVEDGAKHWNYFTWSDGKTMSLISCHEVRRFAAEAQRTFEAAVGHLITGEILAQRNRRISYHEEDRGCLFDFTSVRQNLVLGLRKMIIEPACLKMLAKSWQPVGSALMKAVREYESEKTNG